MVTALLLGVRGAGPHPDGHDHPETSENYFFHPSQQLLFQQIGPEINPRQPRGSPWSLPYSWKSEALDLAQMVLDFFWQHFCVLGVMTDATVPHVRL